MTHAFALRPGLEALEPAVASRFFLVVRTVASIDGAVAAIAKILDEDNRLLEETCALAGIEVGPEAELADPAYVRRVLEATIEKLTERRAEVVAKWEGEIAFPDAAVAAAPVEGMA